MVWDHYVTMMFGVLSKCFSLREIQMGLEAFGGRPKHLNMDKVPPRSTLCDANKNRPASVFEGIYKALAGHYLLNL